MSATVVHAPEGRSTSPSTTILVVEDDVLIRGAAADYLRGCGFVVLEAVDVPQALTVLQADRSVELVFADVKLPGNRSGLDLLHILRQERPHIRVLLTSGVVNASEVGVEGVRLLRKPYFLFEVERHVKALLAGDPA